MSDSIISRKQAEALNALVQDKIAPYLFLCCNYEPTPLRIMSEDGWFVIAVQDLYKFAVDTCPVSKDLYYYIPQEKRQLFSNFQIHLEQIRVLRSAVDHSQSKEDGYAAQKNQADYYNWISSTIGHPEPENISDYTALNWRLKQLASNLIQEVEDMIRCLGTVFDKAKIAERWLTRTLAWYSSNTKTQYYYNQIADLYIARAYSAGNDHAARWKSSVLRRKTDNWITAALCKPYEDQIEECNTTIKSNESILEGNSPLFCSLKRNIPEDRLAIMLENSREAIEEARVKRKAQASALKQLKIDIERNPSGYLYKQLSNRLQELMKELDEAGEEYTLLPQDIMQRDVMRLFANVGSCDNDF